MSSPPTPLELLRTTHQFPGPFVFKAIGRNDAQFVERVVAAARSALPPDAEIACSTRETPNGRHVAVTLEPEVASAEQVLAIYGQLQQVEGLELLL